MKNGQDTRWNGEQREMLQSKQWNSHSNIETDRRNWLRRYTGQFWEKRNYLSRHRPESARQWRPYFRRWKQSGKNWEKRSFIWRRRRSRARWQRKHLNFCAPGGIRRRSSSWRRRKSCACARRWTAILYTVPTRKDTTTAWTMRCTICCRRRMFLPGKWS